MEMLRITSRLETGYRQDLENLLFFHPQQDKHRADIAECVMRYGVPEICNCNGLLRVSIGGEMLAQSLYAFSDRHEAQPLRGVVIYIRDAASLVILHVVIAEDGEGLKNPHVSTAGLMWRMIGEIRDAAARIKGIETVRMLYRERLSGKGHAYAVIPVLHRASNTRGGHGVRRRALDERRPRSFTGHPPRPSSVLLRS